MVKSKIIWFTGLPGSGKTTLSKNIYKKLKKKYKTYLIDGDIFRKRIKNFSFTKKARNKIGEKKLNFAKKLIKKNYQIILVSGVCADKKWRKKIKIKNKNLLEIYVKCSLMTLKKRSKRIFQYFKSSDNYEEGSSKDLVINTDKYSKTQSILKIIKFISKKLENL